MAKTAQDHIKFLEISAARGDLSSMAHVLTELHRDWWDELEEDQQHDVRKLESVYLSLVSHDIRGSA